ncbi:protein insensitive-like [Ceratitis capitata]|uniref:protein insensitive-like n=1 Tax=Ceratitis capitata TaxID=7213 RepID=UPI000329D7B3|nr:protein insensitive-like [Ceratitis capitata]
MNTFNAIAAIYAPELADLTDTYRFQQIRSYDPSEDKSPPIAATVQSTRIEDRANNNIITLMGRQIPASNVRIVVLEDTEEERNRREHATFYKEIGPNKSRISNSDYQTINWHCAGTATRSLLNILFDRETLSTHSTYASGPTSLVKRELNPLKVEDIVHFISAKYGCRENIVRSTISSMCSSAAQKRRRRVSLHNARRH